MGCHGIPDHTQGIRGRTYDLQRPQGIQQRETGFQAGTEGWLDEKDKQLWINYLFLGIGDLDTYSNRIPNYQLPILCELPDIDFDFDSSSFLLKIGDGFGGFAASLANLQENQKSQNQDQNRKGFGLNHLTKATNNSNTKTDLNRDCPLCGDWSPEGYVHSCAKETHHA